MRRTYKRDMFIIGALIFCIMCCLASTSGYFIWQYSNPSSALSTALNADSPNKLSGSPTMDDPSSEPLRATLSAYGFQMDEAYRKGDLQAWSDTANKAAKIEPKNPLTHYALAVTYLGEFDGETSFTNRMNVLTSALVEIDLSIALDPNYGNSYLIRAVCLTQLAAAYPYRADREYLYKLALPDLDKAIKLGTTAGFQPARLKVEYLTLLNQCDEASKLIPSLPRIPNDSKSVNSNKTNEELAARAYACLGQYQQSIDSANKSLQLKNNQSGDNNLGLALALYQAGRSSEAMDLVKKTMIEKPVGSLFFLKAAMEYDQKDFVSALTDGEKADQGSWGAGEYSSYFEGLEAARLGNSEEAILKLQFAEATLEPQFDFAIKRARAELSALNAKPIEVTPAIHFSKNTEKK